MYWASQFYQMLWWSERLGIISWKGHIRSCNSVLCLKDWLLFFSCHIGFPFWIIFKTDAFFCIDMKQNVILYGLVLYAFDLVQFVVWNQRNSKIFIHWAWLTFFGVIYSLGVFFSYWSNMINWKMAQSANNSRIYYEAVIINLLKIHLCMNHHTKSSYRSALHFPKLDWGCCIDWIIHLWLVRVETRMLFGFHVHWLLVLLLGCRD